MLKTAEGSGPIGIESRSAGDADELTAAVLQAIRCDGAVTRPDIVRATGIGRAIVNDRVNRLEAYGLVSEGSLGQSTGGRAPRQLDFHTTHGYVLSAALGASAIGVGVTDLAGTVIASRHQHAAITAGPSASLEQVVRMLDEVLVAADVPADQVWGIGISVPGPVEFATGRPIAPPIMPGWDGYPIRETVTERFGAPVWVDNDVNVMALGEVGAGLAGREDDFIFVKVGTGIGAGLVSSGRLHRGAKGCAGDIGHVVAMAHSSVLCRCGNYGCLEALAGGGAIARDATAAAREGRSERLSALLSGVDATLTIGDVVAASQHGDPVSMSLLIDAGRTIGDTLATLVSFFNPSLLLIGGQVAAAGDTLLAPIRERVYGRSLKLATRDLRVELSNPRRDVGIVGGASMALEGIFSPGALSCWLNDGSPRGKVVYPAA